MSFPPDPNSARLANYDAKDQQLKIAELALLKITRYMGQVCEEFETCTHPACNASYSTWAIAREALDKIEQIGKGE